MKFSRLALLACISAPLVVALALPADDLSFHPAANTEVAKTLKLDIEMNVTEASADFNGQQLPPDVIDQIKQSLIANMVIGVTEKYVETKDGKPLTLQRTFDKMNLEFEFGDTANADEDFKEIEGKTVEFTWNEKDSAYDKKYSDSEGDIDELKDLDADMDLRVLLPDKQVAKGDTWEVQADRLKPLFFPGGMITKIGGEDAADFDKMKSELESQFSQFLKEFKVVCTYKGTKEEDGQMAAQIDFTFDGKFKLDMGSLIEEVIASQGGEEVPEMDVKAIFGMSLKGDGTLLWNVAAGHMANFDMKADAGLDVNIEVHAQQADTPVDVNMTGKAEGKMTWEMAPTTK
ncbi:MAG: hypothetical protein SGI72_00070 [Planctomycetota bacterium]|nr:hypothetical protein [Planctomycetota bacterium]